MIAVDPRLLGRPIAAIADRTGKPFAPPPRPPENDPEYGLTRYITLPHACINILIDWDDCVGGLQFYGARNTEGYAQYSGALPHGLTFRSTRAEVRAAAGAPRESFDGDAHVRPWDWFDHDSAKLHFDYLRNDAGLALVSLLRLP